MSGSIDGNDVVYAHMKAASVISMRQEIWYPRDLKFGTEVPRPFHALACAIRGLAWEMIGGFFRFIPFRVKR